MDRLIATQEFFPVGQGLFASGAIGTVLADRPAFRWVYDCGTVSGLDRMRCALNQLQAEVSCDGDLKPTLDLVVISHFDTDHISGLASLLERFRVETLMLPFTHLAQRLRAMFAARDYTQIADQEFFIDPVGTIAAMEGADIGRIVLVRPAGPDSTVPEADLDNVPPDGPDRRVDDRLGEPVLVIPIAPPANAREQAELDLATSGSADIGVRVELMRSDSAARFMDRWEFVPYNDSELRCRVDVPFLQEVERRRKALLDKKTIVGRKRAVSALRKLYDKRLGASGHHRNVISLFLYCGPVGMHSERSQLGDAPLWYPQALADWSVRPWSWRWRGYCAWRLFRRAVYTSQRAGSLYSGDGYMETPGRWAALRHYCGASRVDELVSFQVMHHGAKGNWHKGIAARIRPAISVFSSDPTRGATYHPHKEVKADFAHYSPVQADTTRGVQIITDYRTTASRGSSSYQRI